MGKLQCLLQGLLSVRRLLLSINIFFEAGTLSPSQSILHGLFPTGEKANFTEFSEM